MFISSYKDLLIWQYSFELSFQVYKVVKEFPDFERYGLSSQLRRSVVSIPSNIAEGFYRKSRREKRYFLSIALGSLAEVETQLLLAEKFEYLKNDDLNWFKEKIAEIQKMIIVFSARLKR